MCGIVGFLTPDGMPDEASALGLLIRMRDQLVHRGPDDGGAWLDAAAGFALGARRLSILDLSIAGRQPLLSADGRYVVAMNGEIYNFPELRAEIETTRSTHSWRGHCDTEVLAEAIALWGLEAAINRANGMFAVAAWDRRKRELWLARDRVGKKPLYYGWAGSNFVFGSELKAFWPHPQFDAHVSIEALAGFLQIGYVLGEQAFFAGVKRLPAGHLLRIDQPAIVRRELPEPLAYWRLRDVAIAGLESQRSGRVGDPEELAALLQDAVACRMVADVPVGSLLSGGIDSSLVTALMCATGRGEVRTFSIGFNADGWDEAQHALAVAKHLGTRHEELYVGSAEYLTSLHQLADICDEPLADNSVVPTVLLSRMAAQSVTVALSGDGGDELFVGYQRYADVDRLLATRASIPAPIRSLAGNLNDLVCRPAAERWGTTRLERRLALLSQLLRDADPVRFQQLIMSQSLDVRGLLTQPYQAFQLLSDATYDLQASTPMDRMTYMDTVSYLVDDILFKVDRASMSASLEVRCPLLDHRIIELSWRFPTAFKCSGRVGKLPLRDILYQHVPRAIVDRPKMGFGAPVRLWLQNELRDWAEALMSPEMLAQHGLLNTAACQKLWEDYTQKRRGWNPIIWNILIFQEWYQQMKSRLNNEASSISANGNRDLLCSFATENAQRSSVLPACPAGESRSH